jgi:hypothetical protein
LFVQRISVKELGGIDVGLAVGSVGIFERLSHGGALSSLVGSKEPFAALSCFVAAVHRDVCVSGSSFTAVLRKLSGAWAAFEL